MPKQLNEKRIDFLMNGAVTTKYSHMKDLSWASLLQNIKYLTQNLANI